MFFDSLTQKKQQRVAKDTILIDENHGKTCLFILHSGEVQMNFASDEELTFAKLPIAIINRPQYFGFETFLSGLKSFPVFSCRTESIISVYPYKSLEAFTSSPENLNVLVTLMRFMSINLRYLTKYNNQVVSHANNLAEITLKFSFLLKKLELTFPRVELQGFLDRGEVDEGIFDPLGFSSNLEVFHQPYKLFQTRDTALTDELIKKENEQQFILLCSKNSAICRLAFNSFLDEFFHIYNFIHQNLFNLVKEFKFLCAGPKSIIPQIHRQREKIDWNAWGNIITFSLDFLAGTLSEDTILNKILDIKNTSKFFSPSGIELGEDSLHDLMNSSVKESKASKEVKPLEAEGKKSEAVPATSNVLSEKKPAKKKIRLHKYSDIAGQDLEELRKFELPQLAQDTIEFLTTRKKTLEDKHRFKKYQMEINNVFMKSCFLAAVSLFFHNEENAEADLLLRYGMLSKEALSGVEFDTLVSYAEVEKNEHDESFDVCDMYSWLKRIAREEESPSRNDLGFSYEKFINYQKRTWSENKKKEYDDLPRAQKIVAKIEFETENMLKSVFKMLSSNFLTVIYSMSSLNLYPGFEQNFITKKKITDTLNEILEIDFLLFFREGLFQVSETTNHIIQLEVKPKIIIVPAVGEKVVFWQEIEELNKRTPARFIVPMIFRGNFKKAMLRALGQYRWEINKTVKGVSWADAVDGGLTGSFIDYVTFYKKNSELSIEAKQKLAEYIRNNRNNHMYIFIYFYQEWMEFESKGLLRLNSFERNMFFRYLPFSLKAREVLAQYPSFMKAINRHNYRHNNLHISFNNRYKKLRDKEGNFPAVIETYLKLLLM